jgi:hypothetical protein
MSYTYNLSTARGQVRLFVMDHTDVKVPVRGEHYVFNDEEIDVFLDLNSEDVWAAASDACMALSADEIAGALRLKLSGFDIDRSKVPEYWQRLAERYTEKSKAGDIVEYVDSFDDEVSDFGEDETEYVGDIV